MADAYSDSSDDFLIIGVGLPRTGTLSTMQALETLLPGRCHHGMKAYKHETEWCRILDGKMSDAEFRHFFLINGYTAGVDIPFILAYEQAMRVFPKAKVLLTTRDPTTWVKSFENTLLHYINPLTPLPYFLYLDLFRGYLARHPMYDTFEGFTGNLMRAVSKDQRIFLKMYESLKQGRGEEFFNEYIKSIKSKVPTERLIEFNVKAGWEPLCRELGVPQPDISFPCINSSVEFSAAIRRAKRRAWLILYEVVTIPLWSYSVYKLTR